MDDIYDDLNNYEDVHALEELRAENKELKLQLENRSAAIEKLQKEILQDYDNLEIAYKHLEKNYSSLLMTARSEIQRKTERITQLNTEKDLMVLEALKNGKHIRRNINVGANHPGRVNQARPLPEKHKNKEVNVKQKNDGIKQKSDDIKQESREPPVLPSSSDSSTYNSHKSSKAAGVKLELSDNRKSNVNDNVAQHKTELSEPPKTTASSIKNRRKSMPVASMPIDTFSSSDELERNYPTKETGTDNERRNINKMPIDRPSNKTCETYSMDDRHKQHESSSGDNYKSRTSRSNDNSSYKGRDKYEVSLKYRKQHSPDRGLKRPYRDHPDEYPKQHREIQEDYARKPREHQDEYSRKSREQDPRQFREHPDDYSRQHKEYPDDYARKPREQQDPRQFREHPDDYARKPREHADDYARKPREHPADYARKPREHPDDYTRQPREHPADYSRQPKEHPADYPRYERGRYHGRSLESPPPESYNRRQRTKSAHRSDYDRYPHDQEKNRYYHDDKYSGKYRPKDYEEPVNKRQRTESYGNPNSHAMDDNRHYHERESVDSQPTPVFSPHEYDMLRFSCQSPDSVHTEAAIANPIKEIKATAATPLDDPRLTSKRYCILNENGKETVSTVKGRNVAIIPVDKAVWKIRPVDIPVALVRRPSQCTDQLVKDIYMDIDDPVTTPDVSMESGEICGTYDEIHETRSKLKEIQHNTQDLKISKQTSAHISMPPVNDEPPSKPNIAKYRIPKIGQNNKNTHSKMDVPIIDVAENVPHHEKVIKKGAAEENHPKELLTHKPQKNKREDFVCSNKSNSKVEEELLTHKLQNNKREDLVCCNKSNSKVEGNKKSKSRDRSENHNQSTLTKMAIVADDLQLSDDNSDHMDTDKKIVPEKVKIICEIPLKISEGKNNDSVNNVQNNTVVSAHNTEIKSTDYSAGIKDVAEEEKSKESDSAKKHKSKRKKSKSKEVEKDSVETTTDPVHAVEKKQKSKKEKDSTPKDTKERFSDLFGDSSSLMTPEDLGIPSYLPISEDAQDAVDVKINQIIDDAALADKDENPGNVMTQNRVEVTIQKTTVHDDVPKTDLQKSNTDVEDKDIKTKASSKRNEEVVDTKQLPSPIVYENLNPGTDLNDPNVVKTVIISTGKQREIAYENNIEQTKPTTVVEVNAVDNAENTPHFATKKDIKNDILKALATSTPHKDYFAQEKANAAKTDEICDPSVSKAVATITNLEPVVNQTESNTLESNDAPDVRIFVKRRRKVVKRPPMT
ncbi:hypothetical protein PYW07_015181 [Mythimna separata]|uniref:Uncharacterized protein n=1 Tax=Mythimna separata TaxID=271217 RepID=A0AAD7YZJ1_MYTSE|nr:hypothetical protein PYW07_015181 [Mythimna separata]